MAILLLLLVRKHSDAKWLAAFGVLCTVLALTFQSTLMSQRDQTSPDSFVDQQPLRWIAEDSPPTATVMKKRPSFIANTVFLDDPSEPQPILQCADCERVITGVDSCDGSDCHEAHWKHQRPIPFQIFSQGEYIGPHRPAHVPEYRVRVDDQIEVVYRLTRIQSPGDYRLQVGDQLRMESLIDEQLDRESITILPDGTITLRLIGQVVAARRTVKDLTEEIEERYKKYYKVPSITVTATEVATKLEDLRATVDSRFGNGGQARTVIVTPEGSISLPAIGVVYVQGLTLSEMAAEINARYGAVPGIGNGIEVTPTLTQRAARFFYVFGEVQNPDRFEMQGPTTVMMALSQAGSYLNGANLREVVVLRRAEDWRLIATRLDLRGVAIGRRPCPADEIWLRDSDIVIVPKSPLRLTTDLIDLLFTQGLYRVMPAFSIGSNL